MIQGNPLPAGGGLQAAASALNKIDLGASASGLLDRRVKEITGLAQAGSLAATIRANDENLGTILDLKA